MERPTIKIKAPSGKEVEIKTYLTARERRQIREIYINAVKQGVGEDGTPTMGSVSGEILSKADDMLINVAVVSYDGSAENILNRLLDGQDNVDDYEFIVTKAGKITKGNFQTAK